VVTISNPAGRPLAVAEFVPVPGRSMTDMPTMTGQMRMPVHLEIQDSVIRAEADLVQLKHVDPVRVQVRDSVVALQGTLLRNLGNFDVPRELQQADLRLEHVTALLRDGLLRVDGGLSRKVLPVHVAAANNLLLTDTDAPLVMMLSDRSEEELLRLLAWSGQRNCYDGFDQYWVIATGPRGAPRVEYDFREWRLRWGPSTEVDPRNELIFWEVDWESTPLVELRPADFAPDRTVPGNPPANAASDGTDAGAPIGRLRSLGSAPAVPAAL
jgi:hypothetical protein